MKRGNWMNIATEKTIVVDYKQPTQHKTITFLQYDTNIINFVMKDNGEIADLNNVTKIVVNFRRPDRKVITQELTAIGNEITYQLTDSEMVKPGYCELVLQLYDDEERLSIARFKVNISENIESGEAPTVEEVRLITQLIETVNEKLQELSDISGGAQGQKGEQGERGLPGERGPQGLRGEQGLQGPKGDKGDSGYTPIKGVDYFDGVNGKDGVDGRDGAQGPKGETGPIGPTGIQGLKGDKGDAFVYSDFTPQQLEALRGPKGDKGDTGGSGGSSSNDGSISVKSLGAVGDGVTDDATIINNAINSLSSQGGGMLRFDEGTYAIGSTINMKSNITLMGVPNRTTILTTSNTYDAITFNNEEINNTQIDGFIIRNTGGINSTARNSGIYYGRIPMINNTLRNIRIVEFHNGIDARTYWKKSLIDSVTFSRCRTTINVEHTESHNVSTVTFINVFSDNPTYRHLKLQYCEGFLFIGCRFQGDGTSGYCADMSGSYVSFQNCRFDGMDSTENNYAMIAAAMGSAINFDNCYVIDYNSTATNTALFEVLSGAKMLLNNVTFEESTGFNYTFRVDSTSRITYSHCNRMNGMPTNSIAAGGVLVDVDTVLTSII